MLFFPICTYSISEEYFDIVQKRNICAIEIVIKDFFYGEIYPLLFANFDRGHIDVPRLFGRGFFLRYISGMVQVTSRATDQKRTLYPQNSKILSATSEAKN